MLTDIQLLQVQYKTTLDLLSDFDASMTRKEINILREKERTLC